MVFSAVVRSYVLNPYKVAKDHRTGVVVKDVQSVLDGEIGVFLDAALAARVEIKKTISPRWRRRIAKLGCPR